MPNLASEELKHMLDARVEGFAAANPNTPRVVLDRIRSAGDMAAEHVLLSGAYMNDVDLMKAAIAEGADKDAIASGNSYNAIQLCARQGSEDGFRYLASIGAKVSAPDFEEFKSGTVEYLPSVIAATYARAGILRIMANELGIDIKSERSTDDDYPGAPLPHLAALSILHASPERKIETLDTLASLGFDFTDKDALGTPLLHNMFHEWMGLQSEGDLPVVQHLVRGKPELASQTNGAGANIFAECTKYWDVGEAFAGAILDVDKQFGGPASQAAKSERHVELGAMVMRSLGGAMPSEKWEAMVDRPQPSQPDMIEF